MLKNTGGQLRCLLTPRSLLGGLGCRRLLGLGHLGLGGLLGLGHHLLRLGCLGLWHGGLAGLGRHGEERCWMGRKRNGTQILSEGVIANKHSFCLVSGGLSVGGVEKHR